MAGTVSLVIAVTGHRDLHLEDAPSFEAEIGKIFRKLRQQYPHTPFVLLSGLAEGADRIAVHAANAEKVPYIAVLPMPADLYRRDFVTEASDAEFEPLRSGALRCIELPLHAHVTREEVSVDGKARDKQYECLGKYLVEYSQILIAIWDQDRNIKPGGTSQVVAMKLREDSPSGRLAFSRMNTKGAGPVYVLPARRSSSGPCTTPALKCEIRYPEPSSLDDYEASYRLLDQFNADVARAGSYFPEAVQQSRRYLFEGEEAIGLSEAMEWVATVYSHADAMAIHFSTVSLKIWKAVFVLLALSGVALTWLHVLRGGEAVLCGYYACLATAFALIVWEWKDKRRGRHEDYRALAEALRVQFFWMAAGLADMSAEQYLRKQAGEVVWIRDAMSECGLYDDVFDRGAARGNDRASRLRLAHTWVVGQANYFLRTRRRHEKKKRLLTIFASTAAALGFIAPLFGLIPQCEAGSHAVAAISLWWVALAWNYIERRGFTQEARQYGRMYDLFHDADEDLKKFEREQNFEDSENTIRELGREALAENGDWLAMHRERKLSVNMAAG